MDPFDHQYRSLKLHIQNASRYRANQAELLREVARLAITRLGSFGLSSGGLCAFVGIAGFEDFEPEVQTFTHDNRVKDLQIRILKLAKCANARIERKPPRRGVLEARVECPSLLKELRAEVLEITASFRDARQKERARRAAKAKRAFQDEELARRLDAGTHLPITALGKPLEASNLLRIEAAVPSSLGAYGLAFVQRTLAKRFPAYAISLVPTRLASLSQALRFEVVGESTGLREWVGKLPADVNAALWEFLRESDAAVHKAELDLAEYCPPADHIGPPTRWITEADHRRRRS